MTQEEGTYDSGMQDSGNLMFRLRDLEEKQRIMKDRLLLIGSNLVDVKEDLTKLRTMAKEKIEEKKEEDDKEIKGKYWVK